MNKFSVAMVVLGLSGVSSIAFAKWSPVHQIASEKAFGVVDGETGRASRPTYARASSNWQSSTTQGFSHALAQADGRVYEFRLVHVQSSNDAEIVGLWDVTRDGALVCDDCVGKAYGLDGPAGTGFKIYVGTPSAYAERWHFGGVITSRFDY